MAKLLSGYHWREAGGGTSLTETILPNYWVIPRCNFNELIALQQGWICPSVNSSLLHCSGCSKECFCNLFLNPTIVFHYDFLLILLPCEQWNTHNHSSWSRNVNQGIFCASELIGVTQSAFWKFSEKVTRVFRSEN